MHMTICLGINIIMIAATITIITTTATMTTAATDTRTELGTELGTNMTTKVAVGASPYRVELSPPDISAYRAGNTGVEYITTFDSGVAGPHVMVNALTHGNEWCGMHVVCRLLDAGLRSAGCGFFYGLLAFHLQRVDPDDGHLQAGLVGAVCGIRSLGAAPALGASLAPSLMMECVRVWLPLWLPLIGSALLLHGVQRLLAALPPSQLPALRP